MCSGSKIGTKITAVVITIVMITVATVSYLAYNLSKKSVERRQSDNLNVLIDNRVDKITAYWYAGAEPDRWDRQRPDHQPEKRRSAFIITGITFVRTTTDPGYQCSQFRRCRVAV